jgi:hypothetical protein
MRAHHGREPGRGLPVAQYARIRSNATDAPVTHAPAVVADGDDPAAGRVAVEAGATEGRAAETQADDDAQRQSQKQDSKQRRTKAERAHTDSWAFGHEPCGRGGRTIGTKRTILLEILGLPVAAIGTTNEALKVDWQPDSRWIARATGRASGRSSTRPSLQTDAETPTRLRHRVAFKARRRLSPDLVPSSRQGDSIPGRRVSRSVTGRGTRRRPARSRQ